MSLQNNIIISIFSIYISFIACIYLLLKLFIFYFTTKFDASSKGQIQPTSESVTRSAGDGSKGRGLLVFQTYARKRTTSNIVDGDAYREKTIMIGKGIK